MQIHLPPSPVRPGALGPRRPSKGPAVPGAVWLGLVLVAAALGGCATGRATREKFLERVPPPQPLLNASGTFAGGILTAQAWLGPSVRLRKPGEHEEETSAPGPRGRLHGRNEERDDFSRYTDPFEEDSGDENKYSQEEIDEMYGRVNYQYVLPPRLALTLTFANTGTRRLTVMIAEISSTLGNFAPRPEQLILGPGQEGALDPMLSNLEDNFNELDVTVGVRIGDRRETQVLKLRHATGPRPGAPAGPTPPAPAK